MRVVHAKLVRDRIPDIIAAQGGRPVTRVLQAGEYREALIAKLGEEAKEAAAAGPAELPGELADVLEVLRALAGELGMTWDDLCGLADGKRSQRGGFGGRLFLAYVEPA